MKARGCAGFLPMICAASIAHAAGIANGSFETPTVAAAGQFQTISAGAEPAGFGWSVTSGSVDAVVQGNQFGLTAFDGLQWLDLDGVGPGSVAQTFSTKAGGAYILTFAYANNSHSEGGATVPAAAQVTVIDIGTHTNLIVPIGIQHSTSTVSNLDWSRSGEISFVALGFTTGVSFSSSDPASSRGGIFLDAVQIAAVPEPPVGFLMLLGMPLLAAVRRSRGAQGG